MNGRIQKLIEECTFIYDDMVYDGTDSYMKTTEYFDKEKFAELIVRECLSVIEEMNPHDPERNIDDIFDEIEEHFGVQQ